MDPKTRGFGAWLAAQLSDRKMSRGLLAKRSGLHRATISRLLRDERRPSIATVERLVTGLGGVLPYDGPERRTDRVARVRHALCDDGTLRPRDVDRVMSRYLAQRDRDPRVPHGHVVHRSTT